MAFIYIGDGQIYESRFHFWYLNGIQPDPALIIEQEARLVEEPIRAEVRPFKYEGDETVYYSPLDFRYVYGHLPEADKITYISPTKSKEAKG